VRTTAIAVFFIILVAFAAGCGDAAKPAAKILKVSGNVNARPTAGEVFKRASAEMNLMVGGAIRTESDAGASLQTHMDSMVIDIFADSYFEVRTAGSSAGYQGEGKAVYEVNKQKKPVVIETPHGTTAVLGTKFGQIVAGDSIMIIVESGKVAFTSKGGENREISAGKKLIWKITEPLAAVSDSNLIDSESFFGSGISSFEFERR